MEGIITHGTNVSYTKQMYRTRNKCIIHGTNVVYTQRMYALDECIHGSSVFYLFRIYTEQIDPTLYLHVEC